MDIIQLSDFHLFMNKTSKLNGYCTYNCLDSVISSIIKNTQIKASAVFITGDLSEDSSLESYGHALKQVERIGLPIHYLAGNHDDSNKLDYVFSKSSLVSGKKEFFFNGWALIKINTVQNGQDSGFISQNEKNYLHKKILQFKDGNIALFMHHHPLKVGIPIVDKCKLINEKYMIDLILEFSELKTIICGHAHTLYSEKLNKCLIDVCPATCFQWKFGTEVISCESRRGYKILSFNDNYSSKMIYT